MITNHFIRLREDAEEKSVDVGGRKITKAWTKINAITVSMNENPLIETWSGPGEPGEDAIPESPKKKKGKKS